MTLLSFPPIFTTLLLLLLSSTISAQANKGVVPTPENSVNAKIFPGNSKWNYTGCYSETTLNNATNGLRTLNGGTMEDLTTMTVQMCLDFCASSGGNNFAGLEYTKECWCSPYLSSIANKLADSECNLACIGNTTQVCGGALKLSVYQLKSSSSKKGAAAPAVQQGSVLALGIAVGVALCFLA